MVNLINKIKLKRGKEGVFNMTVGKTEVTGISVNKGVLSVIDPKGNVRMYRHPLIEDMYTDEVHAKIQSGELAKDLFNFPAFPSDWELVTEEPEITGDLSKTIDSL